LGKIKVCADEFPHKVLDDIGIAFQTGEIHSLIGDLGKYECACREFVIQDEHQAFPEYIVRYTRPESKFYYVDEAEVRRVDTPQEAANTRNTVKEDKHIWDRRIEQHKWDKEEMKIWMDVLRSLAKEGVKRGKTSAFVDEIIARWIDAEDHNPIPDMLRTDFLAELQDLKKCTSDELLSQLNKIFKGIAGVLRQDIREL